MLLKGINIKFDHLLRDVESLKLGIDTYKTELKMLALTTLLKATSKGPTWAQMALITLLPSLTCTMSKSSSGSSIGAIAQELKEDREVIVKVGDS